MPEPHTEHEPVESVQSERRRRWRARFRRSKRPDEPPPWRNLLLIGETGRRVAFVFYSGLSANGASQQRRVAREIYRRFGRRYDIWQRNLWGHTGRYGDFRVSRMWNWIADGIRVVRGMIAKRRNEEVFLVGHSTGALVAVLVAWVVQMRARHRLWPGATPRVCGVALCAPAFRLLNRRDSRLLLLILCVYYCACPLLLLFLLKQNPSLWDAVLIVAGSFYLLLPRIRVPTGQIIYECPPELRESYIRKSQQAEYRALSYMLYFGLFPIVLILLDLVFPEQWVRVSLWFFCATIAYALWTMPKGEAFDSDWEDRLMEERNSYGYRWLPVITAATLLPLQWAARFAVRRLHCPVLMVLSGKDRVVDNARAESLFKLIPANDKRLLNLEEHPHGYLDGTQQLELASAVEHWVRERMPESEEPTMTVDHERLAVPSMLP